MATQAHASDTTLLHTVSGTALSVAASLDTPDLVKTGVLATVGAVVSFGISLLLKHLMRRLRKD